MLLKQNAKIKKDIIKVAILDLLLFLVLPLFLLLLLLLLLLQQQQQQVLLFIIYFCANRIANSPSVVVEIEQLHWVIAAEVRPNSFVHTVLKQNAKIKKRNNKGRNTNVNMFC